jgi:hypothetical protein
MFLAAMVMLLCQAPVSANLQQVLTPAAHYDPRIPTLKQVTGHAFGEEITPPEQITIYLKALASAAPERTRLVEYAKSWEGRPLHFMAIGSAPHIAELEKVKENLRRLADPRQLSAGDADQLVRDLPVVTLLMHAVHGNEISSPEAALALAYHLLASQQDGAVDNILSESVVLIDPLENPDGRARFVTHTLLGRAASPDAEPAAVEHDESWPGGRSNHYLFDMNRDWFAQTQPETRGRTKYYLEWYPHVVVDLHEMGGDSTYYFAPPADPLNPRITKQQAALLELFGRENAKRFDALGFAYFKHEVFDSFYPGYGESWPILNGAVGMTYEEASTRGLVWRRPDETQLTYLEAIVHHFTAALTTAETAARNRARILREFLDYRRSAVLEGERGPIREYLMPPGQDPARTTRLARLIAEQGIEVRRAEEPIKTAARTLPAGTYIFPLAQPASRLLRNLVDPNTPQPEAFLKEQDRRRKKRLEEQFYDITAWSLPQTFDVEVVTTDRPTDVKSIPLLSAVDSGVPVLPPAKVAYLIPWGTGAAAAVAESIQAGIRVHTADETFTIAGRKYPVGTAIVRVPDNGTDLPSKLGIIAARHGAEVVPTDTGYVEDGISLGSGEVRPLKPPRVLLAWDSPADSTSAGWARYVLERRYGLRATAVRTGSFEWLDLRRFDVLVLPAGNYSRVFSGDAVRRLKDWISAGGTLITLGEASRWAAREGTGLLATRTELRDGRPETESSEKDQKKKESPPPQPIDLEKAIQPEKEPPHETPGALARVQLDTEHWLAAGTDGEIQVIVEGRRVFTPIKLDQGRNVGVYEKKERLLVGGLIWEDAQELLAQKAFLIHQPLNRGHIIAFAEDPNYRAFAEATELLFINAVLLGPAH